MRATSSRGPRRLLPLALLAACIVWVHAASLGGPAHLTAHHDNLDGAAPLRVEAARQWRHGHWPLWNPYKRAGMPLLADTTAGAVYPGNAAFLLATEALSAAASPDASTASSAPHESRASAPPAAGEPPASAQAGSAVFRAMDQVAALHALLAGVFLFVFLRALGLATAPCVLGALVYACSGTMGWFAAWYIQIQNSVVWLPLILAAVHHTATGSAASTRWLAVGAFAVALQWLAGFPETSVYSGLIAVAYAAGLPGNRRRPLLAVTAIYGAGMLLACVQLLPALELQSLSRRPESLPLAVFQSLPARAAMVWSWVVPSTTAGLEFPPAAASHFGAAAVAAAIGGVILALAGRSRAAVFFAVLLAVGFLLSIGDATPVSEWAWHVPGLSAFRHPFKHLFELSLAIAGLSAVGADWLVRRRPDSRWPTIVVVAAIAVTCVSLRINQAALVAGNPAAADISGRRPEVLRRLEPGWRVLTPRHVFQKPDPGLLIGDYATQFEVPAVHGAGPYLWRPLADAAGMVEEETTFRRGLFSGSDRTLALLSCRYVLQTRRGAAFAPALDATVYRPAAEVPGARWMQRSDALPRFRFVAGLRCGDAAAVAQSLEHGTPDPRVTALVECAATEHLDASFVDPSRAGAEPADERTNPAGDRAGNPDGEVAVGHDGELAVEPVEERAGRIVLSTRVPAGGRAFLVVSQADFPGWRAHTDGQPAVIRRVHGLVQGIEIPGGTSRVELRYEPRSFAIGAALSAATLALLLLLLVAPRPKRRVDAGEPPAADQLAGT